MAAHQTEPGPTSFFSVALSDEDVGGAAGGRCPPFVPTTMTAHTRQRSIVSNRYGPATARRRHGLSRKEYKNLDFHRFRRWFALFKQQETQRTTLPLVCFKGFCGVVLIAAMGLVMIILGLSCYFWSRGSQSFAIPYKEGDTEVTWKVASPLKPPFHVYAGVSNFFGNQRSFVQSRLGVGFYRCAGFTNVGHAKQVRPAGSFPEVLDQGLSDSQSLFPCGIAQFSYFNDNVTFPHEITSKYTQDDSSVIFPERYLLYTTIDQPKSDMYVWNTPSKSPKMQAWSTPPFSPNYLVMLTTFFGTVPVPIGEYKIKIDVNVWPADAWAAKKSIVIQSLGKAGTRQMYVGIIGMAYGGMLLLTGAALAIALHYDKGRGDSFEKWDSGHLPESQYAIDPLPADPPPDGAAKQPLGPHHSSIMARPKVVPTLEPLKEYS